MAPKKKPNRPRPGAGSRPGPKPNAPRPPAKATQAAAPAAKGGSTAPKGAPAKTKTGPTRAERLAAAEAARRRKATRTRALISLAVVAVLVLLTVTIVASRRSNDRAVARLEASGACKYDGKTDTDSGPGNNHVNGDVRYSSDPPSGGNHNPAPASAGTYTADNKPADTMIVHALEHGYIAVWYKPDAPASTVTDLQTLAAKYDRDILLVPRASLTVPVAATAWHHRLLCTRPDVSALDSFVTTYRNKGPERTPH